MRLTLITIFFTDSLSAKSLLKVELESVDLGDGDVSVPFKVRYQGEGFFKESNEIIIRMLSNQI